MATRRTPRSTLLARIRPALRNCALTAGMALILVLGPERADAARRELYFQAIGSEQGLAQNTVNALLQDHQGFVWVQARRPASLRR